MLHIRIFWQKTHNRVENSMVTTDSLVNFLRNLCLITLIETGDIYIGKNESLSSMLHIRIFWQTHTTELKNSITATDGLVNFPRNFHIVRLDTTNQNGSVENEPVLIYQLTRIHAL